MKLVATIGVISSSRAVLLVIALCGTAARAGAQEVRGRLLDATSRAPIVVSVVTLLDTAMVIVDRTYTDHEGRFILKAPMPGSYLVAAARAGYAPRIDGILDLPAGSRISIDFLLQPDAIRMNAINVDAARVAVEGRLDLQGFYEREKTGFGHFITPQALEKQPPLNAAHLLRGIAGVYTSSDGVGGTTVAMRGGRDGACTPAIYVDGVRVASGGQLVIEDVVDTDDLLAVEVYARAIQAPLQYSGLSNCGVILFWTRKRE